MKLDHIGSKSMTLCQIIKTLCVDSRSLSPVFVKLGQNFCVADPQVKSKPGHMVSNTKSLGQISLSNFHQTWAVIALGKI